jgi:uncharacterized protein YukE
MTKETRTQWDLEEEVERLRDTVEEYYELLEQIVDAYESSAVDLEELEEADLAEALEKAKDYYHSEER